MALKCVTACSLLCFQMFFVPVSITFKVLMFLTEGNAWMQIFLTLHLSLIKCFSLNWTVFWWSALTERLNVSLHYTTYENCSKVRLQHLQFQTNPSVDLQTSCFTLVFCCALWKWFALHVFSISFLLFLPPVNKFVNHPGCRSRTCAQPPALLTSTCGFCIVSPG